jgi:hypothetical protein
MQRPSTMTHLKGVGDNQQSYILIQLVLVCVCDGGFGGWGRERPVKQRVTGGRAGKDRARGAGTRQDRAGELNGCIMHRVHTSSKIFHQVSSLINHFGSNTSRHVYDGVDQDGIAYFTFVIGDMPRSYLNDFFIHLC